MDVAEFKNYYRHALGMFLLGHWLFKNNILNKENAFPSDRIITLPDFLSERFHFIINTPNSNSPTFCCERDLTNWLGRISFNRMVYDEKNSSIFLVTERINGDGANIQDIGEIAIQIKLDILGKFAFLKEKKRCHIKEIFIEDGYLTLSKKTFSTIPILVRTEEEPVFTKKELRRTITHSDVINQNISSSNVYYANYQGAPPEAYIHSINQFTDNLGSILLGTFDEERLFEINSESQRIPEYLRNLDKLPSAE